MHIDEDPGLGSAKGQRLKKKRMALAAGLTAGLLGGGAAGLAFTGNTIGAGAQEVPTTTAPATSAPTAPDGTTRPDHSLRLAEILKPLVDNGTITQAQADAVIDALKAAGPIGGRGGGPGGPGGHGRGMGQHLDVAATALGMTDDELRTELQAGKSIKDVAEAENVDIQKVIDALVADLKTRLAEGVTSGRITQAQADERLANSTERITNMVNGVKPPRPDGPPPAAGDPQTPPANGDASTSTTTPAGN